MGIGNISLGVLTFPTVRILGLERQCFSHSHRFRFCSGVLFLFRLSQRVGVAASFFLGLVRHYSELALQRYGFLGLGSLFQRLTLQRYGIRAICISAFRHDGTGGWDTCRASGKLNY